MERNAFTFWCEKMSKEEYARQQYQEEIANASKVFKQAEAFFQAQDFQQAIQHYENYLLQHKNEKTVF